MHVGAALPSRIAGLPWGIIALPRFVAALPSPDAEVPASVVAVRYHQCVAAVTYDATENKLRNILLSLTQLLLVLTVAVPQCGCQRQGGSIDAGAAVKALLYFAEVRPALIAYAQTHAGSLPDSIETLPVTPPPGEAGRIVYLGRGHQLGEQPRIILLHADPHRFRRIGIPILWSDGTTQSLSEGEFLKAMSATAPMTQGGRQ
jgi:hypothetical protein